MIWQAFKPHLPQNDPAKKDHNMTRKLSTLAMAAFAISLASCGGGESTEPPKGDAIAKVTAPAGKSWAETVTKTELGGYKMGNPDAKLQLLEYGAISCPGCAQFSVDSAEELRAMVDTGVVAFEFRPFLVHGIQDVPGFLLAACNGAESFFGLTEQLYASQSEWLGKMQTISEADQQLYSTLEPAAQITFLGDKMGLVDFVKQRGVSQDAAKMCLTDPKEFDALVKQSERASKDDGISGTPTILINGTRIDGGDWKTIKIALKNAGAR
jgi:protein-disulfide isomerase